jgi:Uma2 family endonuclease
MASDDREEEPMTAIAERPVLTSEITGRLPLGYLTAADLPYIDLDVPFEIQDGALSLMPPPSPWHDKTADKIRHYLERRHSQVLEDQRIAIGDDVRRPDVVGVSMSEDEVLDIERPTMSVQVVEIAVELISHDLDPAKDRVSVDRDRKRKYVEYAGAGIREYWIVDEVPGDRRDASVEMYRLEDGGYRPIRVVLLSELLQEARDEALKEAKTA